MPIAIVWFEIPTLDFERAVKFYSDILGTPVRVQEYMGHTLGILTIDGESIGEITPPTPDQTPSPNGTRLYLTCEGRLDEVAGRVEGAGGKIVQPKRSIGDPGWIVLIGDTEGNVVGLHSAT